MSPILVLTYLFEVFLVKTFRIILDFNTCTANGRKLNES